MVGRGEQHPDGDIDQSEEAAWSSSRESTGVAVPSGTGSALNRKRRIVPHRVHPRRALPERHLARSEGRVEAAQTSPVISKGRVFSTARVRSRDSRIRCASREWFVGSRPSSSSLWAADPPRPPTPSTAARRPVQAFGTSTGTVILTDYHGNETRRLRPHTKAVNDLSLDMTGDVLARCGAAVVGRFWPGGFSWRSRSGKSPLVAFGAALFAPLCALWCSCPWYGGIFFTLTFQRGARGVARGSPGE